VDPHLLRTFVTVVRLGSFSATAAELGYTQAAVSQQIAALEGDLKVTLLNRRPVTPTEAGARLLEHADPILLRLDAARADLARMTQTSADSLIVGITPLAGASMGSGGVAAALGALRRRMPRIDVTVRLGSRSSVTAGVARGELDIGLVDGLTAPGDSLPLLAPLYGVGIAETEVAGVWRVSTIWLGLDHGFSFMGAPPDIFETMVFELAESHGYAKLATMEWCYRFHAAYDGYTMRYSTETEARGGHAAIVAEVRELFLPVKLGA